MRNVLTFAIALVLAGPLLACINDTELKSHDREFRSQYQDTQYQPPTARPASSAAPYVAGGAGILMAAAGIVGLVRVRSRA